MNKNIKVFFFLIGLVRRISAMNALLTLVRWSTTLVQAKYLRNIVKAHAFKY